MLICTYLLTPIFIMARFILYQTLIYLPLWIEYWCIRLTMALRWYMLTLHWCLTLKATIWNKPLLKPGKSINSTYCMHISTDGYSLNDQLRELTRKRFWLDKNPHFTNTYHDVLFMICLHVLMMTLNLFAIIYFMTWVLLYKLGWIKVQVDQQKRPWSKKRGRHFHIHWSVLNMDWQL